MLTNTTAGKRTAGKLMILAAVAVALPLTATRAIDYVDVTPPALPAAPQAPEAPLAPLVPAVLAVQPAAPVAPVPPTPPSPPNVSMQINDGTVTINGQTKKWKDLTPVEKQHIRGEIAKAKAELARTHIDRAGIEREVREALRDAQVSRRDAARDIAQARVEMDRALRQIDTNAVDLRNHGVDPEAIKAQIRASLKAVEAIDVEAITRQAMASVNPEAIAASAAAAEASVAKAQAELDRIEAQLERADKQDEDKDD